MKTIKIEFVSDVSCPWCAVGYNELKNVIEQLSQHVDVQLSWLPFEINPDMGAQGQDVSSYLLKKYGMDESQQLQNMANIEARGLSAGFEFSPMIKRHVYNSFDCHCLLEVAKEAGLQTTLKERLFTAYFQDSVDISNQQSLKIIAQKAGLQLSDIMKAFTDEGIRSLVREQMKAISQAGVTSVPTIIINQKYAVSGAQGEAGYLGILNQVLDT